jgi:hypothetical protein
VERWGVLSRLRNRSGERIDGPNGACLDKGKEMRGTLQIVEPPDLSSDTSMSSEMGSKRSAASLSRLSLARTQRMASIRHQSVSVPVFIPKEVRSGMVMLGHLPAHVVTVLNTYTLPWTLCTAFSGSSPDTSHVY